ncbi:iron transporter [Novosphingobium barchaimii LL02]|uniref:Iron transporter n=1 Tax=Novosphingobium barchaimii LL02 TaxID=1114963 RepID=A0A0J7XH82_9SPHN|nr:hypothetical protein [Novosphingobium barchaimii]KMS51132.1 iron transporter [Novosphingobium barchaimii LL02]
MPVRKRDAVAPATPHPIAPTRIIAAPPVLVGIAAMAGKAQGVGRIPAGRTDVAARLLAAIPANYLLTSLATATLARLLWRGLGVDPANASVAAMLASFVMFSVLALVAFGVRSALKLWLWMIGSGAVLGAGLWLSLTSGGRL